MGSQATEPAVIPFFLSGVPILTAAVGEPPRGEVIFSMGEHGSPATATDLSEKQMAPADARDHNDHRDQNDHKEPPAVKTPVEARAGLISGHIITILILGTILAVVLLGIAWAVIGT